MPWIRSCSFHRTSVEIRYTQLAKLRPKPLQGTRFGGSESSLLEAQALARLCCREIREKGHFNDLSIPCRESPQRFPDDEMVGNGIVHRPLLSLLVGDGILRATLLPMVGLAEVFGMGPSDSRHCNGAEGVWEFLIFFQGFD